MTENSALSPPDVSAYGPDDIPPLDKILEAGKYLRSLGLTRDNVSKIHESVSGAREITARVVVMVCQEGEEMARGRKRFDSRQGLLFPEVQSAVQGAVVEIAAGAIVEQAAELAVHAVAPVIVDTRERIADVAKDVADVAKDVADVAKDVAELKAKLESAPATTPASDPEPAPAPNPAEDKKDRRVSGRLGKGKSGFHSEVLRKELIELFLESHRRGDDGDVPGDVVVQLARRHGYTKSRNTLKAMIDGHIGHARTGRRRGVSHWHLTLKQLAAATNGVADRSVAASGPAVQPEVAPEPTQPTQRKKKSWRWPKSNAKVKTADVLRRFPELTKAQVYRWIAEGKITSYAPEGGRCDGGHYFFLALEVEKDIRRLLGRA